MRMTVGYLSFKGNNRNFKKFLNKIKELLLNV